MLLILLPALLVPGNLLFTLPDPCPVNVHATLLLHLLGFSTSSATLSVPRSLLDLYPTGRRRKRMVDQLLKTVLQWPSNSLADSKDNTGMARQATILAPQGMQGPGPNSPINSTAFLSEPRFPHVAGGGASHAVRIQQGQGITSRGHPRSSGNSPRRLLWEWAG